MQRITTPSAVPDLFGPDKAGFTNGDPVAGIPATWLNAAWFNGVQEELLKVIETAGIVPSVEDQIQLWQALNRMITASLPLKPESALFNPVHATVLSATNTVAVAAGPGAGQVTMPAFSFVWRDALTVSVPAQTFNTAASKVYHLRVAYNYATGAASTTLNDVASPAYNPSGLAELDPGLNATFDDILIARVTTSAANVATIVPLKAASSLTASAKNTVYTSSSTGVSAGWLSSPFITTNFNRTPKVTLSSFNFDAGPNVEMANRIEVRASRTAFQVDCFGYGVVFSGSPTSATVTGYLFITGIWEAHAIA